MTSSVRPAPQRPPLVEIRYVETRPELVPGALVDGKYEVQRVLGEGGMGVVVAARHLELDRIVAIKSVPPSAAANPEIVKRLEREARAAARLQSQHAVHVLDVGRLPSGLPYFVMEYVEGMDLEQVLEQGGPLPVQVAVQYILQACEALAEAHAMGIVHRDLKPSNIFLTQGLDGQPLVKVFDFGISRILDAEAERKAKTVTTVTMGTPSYMAPEQMKDTHLADQRSDLWSLGMVLHELITGSTAFVAGSIPEVIAKVMSSIPAPPLRNSRPGIPAGLETVLARCLEKKPERRYQNVAQLAGDLRPFAPPASSASVERIQGILLRSVPRLPRATGPLELTPVQVAGVSRIPPPLRAEAVVSLIPAASCEALNAPANSNLDSSAKPGLRDWPTTPEELEDSARVVLPTVGPSRRTLALLAAGVLLLGAGLALWGWLGTSAPVQTSSAGLVAASAAGATIAAAEVVPVFVEEEPTASAVAPQPPEPRSTKANSTIASRPTPHSRPATTQTQALETRVAAPPTPVETDPYGGRK